MNCSTCKVEAPTLVGSECWACANPRPEHDDPAHWAAARPEHEILERGIDNEVGITDK